MLSDPAILEQTLTQDEGRVLRDLVERIRDHWGAGVRRLAVFGSRARGDVTDESDIDLLVVLAAPHADERRASDKVWDHAVEAMGRDRFVYAPVAPCVLSVERFDRLLRRGRRFAVDADTEGIRL